MNHQSNFLNLLQLATYQCLHTLRTSCIFNRRIALAVLFFLGLTQADSSAQTGNSVMPVATRYTVANALLESNDNNEYYDEVLITLYVPRIGSLEIQAIVYNEQLYLPIKGLFDFLKIRNSLSPDFDVVEGFFIYPQDTYSVDKINNRIVYRGKPFNLDTRHLIRTEDNLYLKSQYFGQIFGLECSFDFRNLSVTLNTAIELPAIREMQQELMRRNINQLRGERKADTVIERSYPFLHFGMADWGLTSLQETKKGNYTRFNLGLGGILAGGEINLGLNYYSREPLTMRQQSYQWRYVDNKHSGLRQITLGKIYPQSVSSVFAPVIGLQLTNAPTTYRRSFGTFTLSNTTGPGWMVELYINNVLVNYTKADASGFFTFEVPMVYGNSIVKLRFYGPWGEESMTEKYISVPFNFIPVNQLEYTVSAGIVENNDKARFARANLNYGLSRNFTVGGGVEYLSSVSSGKLMPFVNASLVLGSHLLVSAVHTYGVSSKLAVNYRLPSNLQFDVSYSRYVKGQTAILINYVEEKKLVISMPMRGKKFTAFSRLSLNQFTFPFSDLVSTKTEMRYTSAEYLFSSVIAGINSNFTTYALFTDKKSTSVYTNLSLAIRFPAGIRFLPQAQYEYKQGKFNMMKAEIEKNLFIHGFLSLSYEKNFTNQKNSLLSIGFRYNFSFAKTFFSASTSGKSTITTQSARGSLMVDGKTRYVGTSNETYLGKGGIVVSPYLDLNCNGARDPGEPKAVGLKLHINGGRIERDGGDTVTRISGLEAYTHYFLELDKSSFDNIAWQLQKHTFTVIIEPNRFKLIEIPVAVVGEVSGTVSFKENNELKVMARIIVNIYNSKSHFITKVLTESDGFFSYVGLPPGEYTASMDPAQLIKLNMVSSPAVPFKIRQNKDGDVVEGLRFVLEHRQ